MFCNVLKVPQNCLHVCAGINVLFGTVLHVSATSIKDVNLSTHQNDDKVFMGKLKLNILDSYKGVDCNRLLL